MLGIRHYRGVAIDLWQGPGEDFLCDALAEVSEKAGVFDFCKKARGVGLRHVSFVFLTDFHAQSTPGEAFTLMKRVRDFLDLDEFERSQGPFRITFILKDRESHAAFQKALFGTFQDGI